MGCSRMFKSFFWERSGDKGYDSPTESVSNKEDLVLEQEIIYQTEPLPEVQKKNRNQGTYRESSMTRQLEGSTLNLLAASRNLT